MADNVCKIVSGIPVYHKGNTVIIFETIAVALAMFSALPMPQPEWNEKNMRYAMCAFPLVGVVIALAWWGWAAIAGWLEFPTLLRAAGFCLLPVLITGGIHLDGYADTSDALASWAPPERRQEILQDTHCGAFAVIRLCTLFAASFALCGAMEVTEAALWCGGLSFVLSRSLSGLAIAWFPLARNTGLAHTFATAAAKSRTRAVLTIVAVLTAAALCALGGWMGVVMVLAALAALGWYHRTAMKLFGGISGDLAGWFLQKAELWMLAALVLYQCVEARI